MRTNLSTSFELAKPALTIVGKPKIIDRNTFRYRTEDGAEVVRLHLTDIVVKKDGKTTLNSGGWKTSTTKDRINSYGGCRVISDKGQWIVQKDGESAPFYDGITLPDVFKPKALAKARAGAMADLKLKADIKKFVTKTIVTGKPIPTPSEGDCWDCLMFDREEPVEEYANAPRGAAANKPAKQRNSHHLLEHIKEGYMHGSLIVNAFRDSGYTDTAISYWCFTDRPDYTMIRRKVRRYLQKRLGLTY